MIFFLDSKLNDEAWVNSGNPGRGEKTFSSSVESFTLAMFMLAKISLEALSTIAKEHTE